MTQLRTRIAYLSLVLQCGLSVGCGSDEAIFTLPEAESDAGDDSVVAPTPSNVAPGPSSVQPVPVAPSPTTGPATSNLAARCTTSAQCGTGMVCKTAADDDFLGGGPANGYCTVDCTTSVDDSLCEEYQAGAICLRTNETEFHCVPGCAEGVDPGNKCQGRADVACDFVSAEVSFCRPACVSDAECGGKRCHLGSGTCVDELDAEGPIGSVCDPAAETNTCASSFCIRGATPGTSDTGMCSGLCTVGALGCGETEQEPDDPGAAFCANFIGQYSGVGDLGLCFQRCDCDDHCLNPEFRCLVLPEAQAEGFGVRGVCMEYDFDLTGADPGFVLGVECPGTEDGGTLSEGGADAATDGGETLGGDAEAVDAMTLPPDASGADATLPDGAMMSLNPDAAADAQ